MSRYPHITAWFMAMILAAVALFIPPVMLNCSNEKPNMPNERDNPERFHLVVTPSSYDYSFTYDPLAQDRWLFRAGGFVESESPLDRHVNQ